MYSRLVNAKKKITETTFVEKNWKKNEEINRITLLRFSRVIKQKRSERYLFIYQFFSSCKLDISSSGTAAKGTELGLQRQFEFKVIGNLEKLSNFQKTDVHGKFHIYN